MADEAVTAALKGRELHVVAITGTELARTAASLHQTQPASAALLAQGLVAAALLSALQLRKGSARVNFQLECDGPLRGLFTDADGDGDVRGYVKVTTVEYQGRAGAYRWRPVLGNSGFLSVLRDSGKGEFFRSAVELREMDVALDLERYFQSSDQVDTAVFIEALPVGDQPLGVVAGLLVQPFPGGDHDAVAELRKRLRDEGGFSAALSANPAIGAVHLAQLAQLAELDGGALEITSRYPLAYRCGCSKDRVVQALIALGREGIEDILAKEGAAEVTCEFCRTRYTVGADELRALASRLFVG